MKENQEEEEAHFVGIHFSNLSIITISDWYSGSRLMDADFF